MNGKNALLNDTPWSWPGRIYGDFMNRAAHVAFIAWCIVIPDVSRAGFDEGLAAYNGGDYATAMKEWQPLADQGNAGAQNSLGAAYEKGYGKTQSYTEAVKMYTKAAEQGNEAAQFNLGRMYAKGRGVEKSLVEAVKWYAKSAEQGNAAAQNNLGLAYSTGQGVKKNEAEAVKWYIKAADQGHVVAQFNLGIKYAKGRGVKKSDVKAVKWFAKAAAHGHAGAQSNLGWMYANGYGVEKNNSEAVKWFTKSAKQGNAVSQHWLKFMHSEGAGVEKISGEAAKLYFNAAEQFAKNEEQGDVNAIPARAATARQNKTAKTAKAVRSPKAGRIFRDCPNCPKMVVIPSGSFDMGSPDSESGRDDDESPLHRVNVATFALGITEITRGEFAAFVKKTKYSTSDKCWTLERGKFEERSGNWRKPGYPQDDQHPVTCINWNDAQAYAKWMSQKTGKKYRLPTEAEWEYAARGNTSAARYWGDRQDWACGYANTADKTAQEQIQGATSWWVHDCADEFANTAPVGSFKDNEFGLNDMLGNVWEWTEDSYHDSYKSAPPDGSAWQVGGAERVLRGGSWNNSPQSVRAAVRNSNNPVLRFSIFGFRIARKLP